MPMFPQLNSAQLTAYSLLRSRGAVLLSGAATETRQPSEAVLFVFIEQKAGPTWVWDNWLILVLGQPGRKG